MKNDSNLFKKASNDLCSLDKDLYWWYELVETTVKAINAVKSQMYG